MQLFTHSPSASSGLVDRSLRIMTSFVEMLLVGPGLTASWRTEWFIGALLGHCCQDQRWVERLSLSDGISHHLIRDLRTVHDLWRPALVWLCGIFPSTWSTLLIARWIRYLLGQILHGSLWAAKTLDRKFWVTYLLFSFFLSKAFE